MSSKIYFSDKSHHKPISYYLIKALSGSVARIAPKLGNQFARRLLLTPVRHQAKSSAPHKLTERRLDTPYSQLRIYELGEGPVVLFTHGWSGSASQFFPLMENVAQQGFKAVAFDHYAHGKSAGKVANLPLFVRAVEAVKNSINADIVAAISHSMGCIAALNKVVCKTHILLAPPFDFYNGFEARILGTGISKRLFKSLVASVEGEHNMQFETLLPEQHLSKHKRIFIVHDEDDKFAFHHLTQQIASAHAHIDLQSTKGLGHSRVINDAQTWQSIKTQLDAITL